MTRARINHRQSSPGLLMLTLLMLCALLGGGSIAQVHVHPLHAAAQDGRDRSSTWSTSDEDCALCDARVAFEPLLPADTPLAPPPGIVAATEPAIAAVAYPLPAPRGPGWRSRAPPVAFPT